MSASHIETSAQHMQRLQAFLPQLPLRALRRIREVRQPARWTCSSHGRRKNVGVPKNVQVGPVPPQLKADETPWEDYLIPTLEGNSSPKHPERFVGGKPFVVLGVESSCDDTAAAVVTSEGTVLSDVRVNQKALTEVWGGVVPNVARDAHADVIDKVIQDAILQAGMKEEDLDGLAASMGPGLEICLRVGYRATREISQRHDRDFVGVNHLEAHLLVSRLASGGTDVKFPFLTLLVSGGHCQLLLVKDVADYEVIGGTLDDALGEAYDKTARLLGLEVGGGGGPALEKLAEDGDPFSIPFPVPMIKRADCNFSFAGLKTSVRVAIDKLGGEEVVREDREKMANIAASFQEIAIRHLEQRVKRCLIRCKEFSEDIDTLVVSGGVASNKVIRNRLTAMCDKQGWKCVIPEMKLCTDNGVMVAWAGIERLKKGIADDTLHLDVRARWPLGGVGEMSNPLPSEVQKKKKKKLAEV